MKRVISRGGRAHALPRIATAPTAARPLVFKNRRRESFCLIKTEGLLGSSDIEDQWAILLDEFAVKSKELFGTAYGLMSWN
jgi:hypothetical protein